ncbi:MAG TPA: CBS domain-containing protein [Nitrososphaeraceae archaeon]|nr:CBS domain-containing protein [Nitrososphaeraceae archaeon]
MVIQRIDVGANHLGSKHRDANMTTRILVRDIMNSPIISSSPDSNIKEIAEKMKTEKIGSIVIFEAEKPVGIVTDWDIVTDGFSRDVPPSSIKTSEIMKKLYTIEGEATITEAARMLRKHNIKRLGVVYKNRVVGIISSSDVISVTPELIDVISEKAALIRGEIGRPTGHISGYCDECGEWTDLLLYSEGTFTCEECRGESSLS